MTHLSSLLDWLRRDYALDDNSAWQVVGYAASQLDSAGAISSDRAVIVEYQHPALPREEITGADLLVRSGLEAVVDPSSGLGIIVCRLEGQALPVAREV